MGMQKPALLFICIAAAALPAACGWKADGVARLDELAPLPDAGDAGSALPDASFGDVGGTGLPGRWAVHLTEPGNVAPQGLEPWAITINDYFIAEIDEAATSARLTFCDQIVESTGPMGLSTTPDMLIAALAASDVVIPLPGDGTFTSSDVAWVWGVKDLADTAHGSLVDHAYDQDADGNPGVTVDVTNPDGRRYLVRRSVWQFEEGTLDADSRFLTGKLAFTVEETALGATSDLLMTVAPIEPIVRGSKYELNRVGTEYTCKDYLGK